MGFFTVFIVAATVGTVFYAMFLQTEKEPPELKDGYWGRDDEKDDDKQKDTTIKPFKIKVSKESLTDLNTRLKNTKLGEDLENTQFQYGFQVHVMRDVITYWRDSYDWQKQEAMLNKFPQFKTRIEGIDIHFLHIKPSRDEAAKRARPILISHGWPGSVMEFYKLIPLLTEGEIPFEVVCPSIPGYGFSEAPHQPGFGTPDTARVWMKLMSRLGHDKFYVQGGDWGGIISTIMAQAYPDKVLGLHINMFNPPMRSLEALAKQFVALFVPNVVFHPFDVSVCRNIFTGFGALLRETGYLHIQATRPDTVAFGLTDSPVGLAAYILEKFSVWTNRKNYERHDGGLTEKFTLDELLTNVMIYWVNGNIGSSMRYYKESLGTPMSTEYESVPVKVPAGLALFPEEFFSCPEGLAKIKYKNIKQFSRMPRGGHFAALEEPELLANDVIEFVRIVEREK